MNNISDIFNLLILGILLIAITVSLRYLLNSFEARNERGAEKAK